MKYYHLRTSYDPKIVGRGKSCHSDQAKHNTHVDNPMLIDKFHYEKIEIQPIVSNAIVHDKANVTDLIGHINMSGLGSNLLISDKLKEIFETHKVEGAQFFQSNIIHKDKEVKGFWLMYPYELHIHLIDYLKSEIYITKASGIKIDPDPIRISSYDEYEIMNQTLAEKGYENVKVRAKLSLEKIVIKENVTTSLINTLMHNGSHHLVSEDLKISIEEAGCTGIEFQPSEMNRSEWGRVGGYKEDVYGYR